MADKSKSAGRGKPATATKPETMTPASRKSRMQKAKPAPTAMSAAVAGAPVSPEARYQMIEREAYYRAEQRGFAPGDTLRDWFEAEAEVDRILRGD